MKYLYIFLISTLLSPLAARAATLSFSPSSGSYSQGSTLKVNVYANTGGDSINAVQANFTYPSNTLQFTSISTGGSALTILAEKAASGGSVRIAGGNPSPFSGSKYIASVFFKVLANSGSATLSFTADSAVVRSSDNQNSLTGTSPATFRLSPPSASTAAPTPSPAQAKITDIKVVNLTKNTATITWKTDINSDSVVEYGLTTSYGLLASSDQQVTNHEIIIPPGNLYPGTTYYFRVGGEKLSFTTRGYEIIVNVKSSQDKPIDSAEVTIYSEPKTGMTDKNGVIKFADVSPGRHALVTKYKGVTHTQEMAVLESDTSQTFDIKLPAPAFLDTKTIFMSLGVFLLLIASAACFAFAINKSRGKVLSNVH